jgi:hypothetical protein
MTLVWAAIHDRCACNQPITTEPYFGLLMGEEQDEDAIVYFDPAHLPCMGEWGVILDYSSDVGIAHMHYPAEEVDEEDIRPS